jgi:hypothetical protein
MSRGIIDVLVTEELNEDTIVFITDCSGGLPPDVQHVRDGARVTLKTDRQEKQVIVRKERGEECAFHYVELSPQLAKELSLRNGMRYTIKYDSAANVYEIARMPKTQLSTSVTVERQRTKSKDTATIGYALLSLLGMAENQPTVFTLKNGKSSKKLKLIVPVNELDSEFRVPPSVAAQYGLENGKPFLLEYNQNTKVLTVLGPATLDISRLFLRRKRRKLHVLSLRRAVAAAKSKSKKNRKR